MSFPLTSRPLQSFLAPSSLIWLLLMSRWTSTLLTLRASPRASAPSLPMPFQERLSIFSAPLPSRERRGILATACPSFVPLCRFLPGWDRSISQVTLRSPNESNISAMSPGSLHPRKSPDLLTALVFLLALTATVSRMNLARATESCSDLRDVSSQCFKELLVIITVKGITKQGRSYPETCAQCYCPLPPQVVPAQVQNLQCCVAG